MNQTQETQIVVEQGITYTVNTYSNGDKFYFKHNTNLHHREHDLPAIELTNGGKFWLFDGKLHRLAGPAQIDSEGKCLWWYDNHIISVSSQQEYQQWLQLKIFQ